MLIQAGWDDAIDCGAQGVGILVWCCSRDSGRLELFFCPYRIGIRHSVKMFYGPHMRCISVPLDIWKLWVIFVRPMFWVWWCFKRIIEVDYEEWLRTVHFVSYYEIIDFGQNHVKTIGFKAFVKKSKFDIQMWSS